VGACELTFNKIVIQNQKADSDHYDTDWLHVVWYTGGPNSPATITQTFPLLNVPGSFQLHTGDVIPPYSLYCNANDTDVVMAVYAITNLGSSDYSDQLNQATQITDQIAQQAADAYLTAARMYLEGLMSELPGGTWIGLLTENVVDPHWDDFLKTVNGAIDQVFTDVINPIVDWLAGEVQNLLGSPNCNGEVLHDYVIFVPNDTNDGSLTRFYTGPQDNSACGEAAHTEVDITLHREVQLIGQFGPVIQQNPSDVAQQEFRNRAQVAAQEGYAGGFPNFYYGITGQANVGGTIFIKTSCGHWTDVAWSDLAYPPLDNFALRILATDIYATNHSYAGGFPTFFQAQHLSAIANMGISIATKLIPLPAHQASRFTSARGSTFFPALGSVHPNATFTVCGTVLINQGCATRRYLPLVELPDLTDIGALFRAVQDYAKKNGFVGGFPTFHYPESGPGIVSGRGPAVASMIVVLLPEEAAVWQDVVLFWNPS
jgi:hypothetical protein